MFKRVRRVCSEGRKELREESDSEDGRVRNGTGRRRSAYVDW